MELTDLTVRLFLLFFPGFVCAIIFSALTEYKDRGFSRFLVLAFVLGLSSYVLLGLGAWLISLVPWIPRFSVAFFDTVTGREPVISWPEILWATAVAVALALGLTAASTHKILHRAARRVGIAKLSGELDMWAFTFNSPDVEWVVVRDLDANLAYEGWVQGFSISSERPELLLKDVKVFRNESGEELYRMDGIYLAMESRKLRIEIPGSGYVIPDTESEEKNAGQEVEGNAGFEEGD